MKNFKILLLIAMGAVVVLASCKKFDKMLTDPNFPRLKQPMLICI